MSIHNSLHLHKPRALLLQPVPVGLLFLCLHVLLLGCGSTNGLKAPGSSHLPSPNGILTRFDVDVKTGKVRITPGQGGNSGSRAILTGGAVSFFSSDLLSVGGDSGKRLLHIRVVNNTNEAIPGALRLVIGNLANSLPVDGKANTFTTTLAGNGTASSTDGYGMGATFNAPMGVTGGGSAAPNIFYVSDSAGNRIRKVYADGNVITFAGSGTAGSADGTGSAARFNLPTGVAVDSVHNVYVADFGNHRVCHINPQAVVKTIMGGTTQTSGFVDGYDASPYSPLGRFNGPRHIAVEANGNILVSDENNNSIRLIQRVIRDAQTPTQ